MWKPKIFEIFMLYRSELHWTAISWIYELYNTTKIITQPRFLDIQCYPQRMRLQRWLYWIFTACFLYIKDSLQLKLVSFFSQSLKCHTKLYVRQKIWFNLGIVLFKEFKVGFIFSFFVCNSILTNNTEEDI